MLTRTYFANVGPHSGPILRRHGYHAIGVLRDGRDRTPIGMALSVDADPDGRSLWEVSVYDFDVPGLWVVVDREFRPVRPAEGEVPA
jgi:hypothetical protein